MVLCPFSKTIFLKKCLPCVFFVMGLVGGCGGKGWVGLLVVKFYTHWSECIGSQCFQPLSV